LPASPKIFHGRDSGLNDMIDILLADRPRVAILGPGGIGKTTLALAALHNPVVVDRYNQRHFIPCETASSSADLASIMGSILGLEPSKQLSRVIVAHFAESGPTLILLDNFETPWEPLESRAGVEEFISLLADIPTLALLITMRGAERPGKVKWSRPFLPVLEPLSKKAAHQVFADIAGEPSFKDQIAFDKLLDLSGGLPLAVSLLASVASFEGYSDTLDRWNVENTSLLSDGVDKSLNLEKSILLSLGSPRISSSAPTRDLLSLLCLLPGGITEAELITSHVLNPTSQISHSKSTLLRTSLAYIDVYGRLRILNPIRQYVRSAHPPPASLYWPLVRHF
ncbi:P-loop containing nucleoside triphosphate hydrolase protein, partial [Mycena metata]